MNKLDLVNLSILTTFLLMTFLVIYILISVKGYDEARRLCPDNIKYNFEYIIYPVTKPVCLMEKVNE